MTATVLPRAVCPTCGRRMDVKPNGESAGADVFPRHPRRRSCPTSGAVVRTTDYVGAARRARSGTPT